MPSQYPIDDAEPKSKGTRYFRYQVPKAPGTFWGLVALAAAVGVIWHGGPALAATSVLNSLMESSKAVVQIKAENGGFFGTKPQAFIHKETGLLMIQHGLTPVYQLRTGAGVIIDPAGLIATNKHTVANAGRITVTLYDQISLGAQLVYVSENHDVALIKITPPHPLTVLEMSNSDDIQLDNKVYSIGSSDLLKNTISEGRVRGVGVKKERTDGGDQAVQLIEIDFDLHQGDSGSPLLDAQGKLLGIMSAQAIGRSKETYAVPSNVILKTIRQAAITAVKS